MTGLLLANSGYAQPNITPRYEPITIAQTSAEETHDSDTDESVPEENEEQKKITEINKDSEINEDSDTLDSKLNDTPVKKTKKIKRLNRRFETDYINARKKGLINPESTLGSNNYPYVKEINTNVKYTPIKTNWNETITDFSQIEEIANSLSNSITGRPLPKELNVEILPEDEFKIRNKKNKTETTTGYTTREYSAADGWKFSMVLKQMPKKEQILLFMHEYGHIISGHPDKYVNEALSDGLMAYSYYLLSTNDKTYDLDIIFERGWWDSIKPVHEIYDKFKNLYKDEYKNKMKGEFEQNNKLYLEWGARLWNYGNTHTKEEIDNLNNNSK